LDALVICSSDVIWEPFRRLYASAPDTSLTEAVIPLQDRSRVVQFDEAQSKLAQDDCFDGFVTRVSMDRAAAPSCRFENVGLG
jgi:hypothetical protein